MKNRVWDCFECEMGDVSVEAFRSGFSLGNLVDVTSNVLSGEQHVDIAVICHKDIAVIYHECVYAIFGFRRFLVLHVYHAAQTMPKKRTGKYPPAHSPDPTSSPERPRTPKDKPSSPETLQAWDLRRQAELKKEDDDALYELGQQVAKDEKAERKLKADSDQMVALETPRMVAPRPKTRKEREQEQEQAWREEQQLKAREEKERVEKANRDHFIEIGKKKRRKDSEDAVSKAIRLPWCATSKLPVMPEMKNPNAWGGHMVGNIQGWQSVDHATWGNNADPYHAPSSSSGLQDNMVYAGAFGPWKDWMKTSFRDDKMHCCPRPTRPCVHKDCP